MNEAQFQEAVLNTARLAGWRHMHVRRSVGKGAGWVTATNVPWPDLTLWHEQQGRFLIRELKVPKRKSGAIAEDQWKPGQREVLAGLHRAGVDVGVWVPADLANGTIDRELGLITVAPRTVP